MIAQHRERLYRSAVAASATYAFCWARKTMPAAHVADGPAAAALIALVAASGVALVALCGFILVQVTAEEEAEAVRQEGEKKDN